MLVWHKKWHILVWHMNDINVHMTYIYVIFYVILTSMSFSMSYLHLHHFLCHTFIYVISCVILTSMSFLVSYLHLSFSVHVSYKHWCHFLYMCHMYIYVIHVSYIWISNVIWQGLFLCLMIWGERWLFILIILMNCWPSLFKKSLKIPKM
jgi:hypothetical protein